MPAKPKTHREDDRDIHDILPRHMHRLMLRLQPAQKRGHRRRQPPVMMVVVMMVVVVLVVAIVVAVGVVISPAVVAREGSGRGQAARVRAGEVKGVGMVVPGVRQLCLWGVGWSMRRMGPYK